MWSLIRWNHVYTVHHNAERWSSTHTLGTCYRDAVYRTAHPNDHTSGRRCSKMAWAGVDGKHRIDAQAFIRIPLDGPPPQCSRGRLFCVQATSRDAGALNERVAAVQAIGGLGTDITPVPSCTTCSLPIKRSQHSSLSLSELSHLAATNQD